MSKLTRITTAIALALTISAPAAMADQPGAHPAYLHALTNLRAARWNIARRKGDAEMRWDEHKAIGDIDAAIREIKAAAIDDGKNLDDHPPAADNDPYQGRLHKAHDLLKAAHDEVNREEDNDYAHGLKHRAVINIDRALNRTREALCNAGDKGYCGGY